MATNTNLPIPGNGSGVVNPKPASSLSHLFAWFAGLFRRPSRPVYVVPNYSVKKIDAKALQDAKHKQLEDELLLPFELRQRLERMRRKAVAS